MSGPVLPNTRIPDSGTDSGTVDSVDPDARRISDAAAVCRRPGGLYRSVRGYDGKDAGPFFVRGRKKPRSSRPYAILVRPKAP